MKYKIVNKTDKFVNNFTKALDARNWKRPVLTNLSIGEKTFWKPIDFFFYMENFYQIKLLTIYRVAEMLYGVLSQFVL